MQFINPEELPPEILEGLRRQLDRRGMSNEVVEHDVRDLLNELTRPQLEILHHMFHHCHEPLSIAYYQGQIVKILDIKFGKCPCGQDHSDPHDLIPEADLEVNPELSTETSEEEYGAAARDELMAQYGVEWAGDDDDPFMRCIGCKTPIFSLEDRMLRPPGVKGCSSCQQMTKWG